MSAKPTAVMAKHPPISAILGRVSESSVNEVDNLIDELQRVRETLRDDGNRIQRDIEEYAALSQQVMKLTQIISESMQKLPNASRVIGLRHLATSAFPPSLEDEQAPNRPKSN